ncbi:MAG: polynucleotide adenylyltransferase [Acidobacteria bacterium]|nr:MAG: polynucleotide adenylyltransferase [Acidobacteriota bacterium]
MSTPDEPLAEAIRIARLVRAHGGRALIIGGWVRDRLMGHPSKDIDIEVFGVEAEALKTILQQVGTVNTVGESFTVYKVAGLDVSLPRRESKIGRGHKAFQVTGDPSLSHQEAARRRDFTINAIAWDPLTDEYIDPFHGREDIRRRVLRAVDSRTFAEDSLRVLRAIQLAARFEFVMDPPSAELCRWIPLDDLPAERIWTEIEKLLLRARRPSLGFSLALHLGVIERLFPELDTLVGCPQEPEWHPEGDVWVHTLLVIDQARARIDDLAYPQKVTVMLGAVCHDLGKPATTAFIDGRIRSLDHESEGVPPATALLDRLNIHSLQGYDVRREVLGIVAHHLKPGMFAKAQPPVSDGAFRRLAQKVDLELLARVARADCEGRGGGFDCSAMDWFLARARELGVEHAPPEPLVKGRHLLELGATPGPAIGEVLRQVYERQLDGSVASFEEALALARDLARERQLY